MKRMYIQLNSVMVAELNEKMKATANIGELPGNSQDYILAEIKSRSYHSGESQLYALSLENLLKIGYTKSFVDRQAGWQEITSIDEEVGVKAIKKSISEGWEYIRFREPDKGARSDVSSMVVVSMALNGIKIENQGTIDEKVIRQIVTPFITSNCDKSDNKSYNDCVRNIKLRLLEYYVGDITSSSKNAIIDVDDIINNEVSDIKDNVTSPPKKSKEKSKAVNILKGRKTDTTTILIDKPESPPKNKGKSTDQPKNKGKSKAINLEKLEPTKIAPYGKGYCDIDLYDPFLSGETITSLIDDIDNNIDVEYTYYYSRSRPSRSDVKFAWITDNEDWVYAFNKFHVTPLEPQGWTKPLLDLKKQIENLLDKEFNAVLINKYEGGTLAWHHDDDPWLGDDFVVASISMGQERSLSLRKKEDAKKRVSEYKVEQITMPNGSLLVMHGNVQKNCEHAVLDKPGRGRTFKTRYNLTFRNIVDPSKMVVPNKTKISLSDIIKQADNAKDKNVKSKATDDDASEESDAESQESEGKVLPKRRVRKTVT